MCVKERLILLKKDIPSNVKLIAVSKFHSAKSVWEAYEAGQHVFGESRAQELEQKLEGLPADIEWHFIGHLQTNKVRSIVSYINTIHSIDSWKLLSEINKAAIRTNRIINCLLEVYIAEEDSKYGLTFDECRAFLTQNNWKDLLNVRIIGLMGMATNTDDQTKIRQEFKNLKMFFEELRGSFFSGKEYFTEISMGMSHDYKIAISEGATMVRIGTSIFGEREY